MGTESDVIPVQRNEADFVPETEDEDEDVSSDAGVVEPAKKKKQGNIRVGRYDYTLMLRSISAKRLFVFLDTALPPWVACFCLRVTVSFQTVVRALICMSRTARRSKRVLVTSLRTSSIALCMYVLHVQFSEGSCIPA